MKNEYIFEWFLKTVFLHSSGKFQANITAKNALN